MKSPWWWVERLFDGTFGRKPAQVAVAAMFTVVAVGVFWRAPEAWAIRSFLHWKTHELEHLIQPWLRSLSPSQVRYPIHPGRAPVRTIEHPFATITH